MQRNPSKSSKNRLVATIKVLFSLFTLPETMIISNEKTIMSNGEMIISNDKTIISNETMIISNGEMIILNQKTVMSNELMT